jgi:hypothetical protein
MRQYKTIPPWLAPLNTPKIGVVTGLGIGGGAGVDTADSGGFGDILVFAGKGALGIGQVGLTFPAIPAPLFVSGEAAFGTITQATVGNIVTISWTGANFQARAAHPYKIHYEWLVSQ